MFLLLSQHIISTCNCLYSCKLLICSAQLNQFQSFIVNMSENFSALKSSRKFKKDLLQCRTSLYSGNGSMSEINNSKLSLGSSTLRSQKLASTSLEKLSFISEKDNTDYENYEIDYAIYLLRKLQNRVLLDGKQSKEENVKKCFLSLKIELEELLEKHVNLQKKLAYISMYAGVIGECNKKIEQGKKIFKYLKDNQIDDLFKSLSDNLESRVNQLHLVGITGQEIENLFEQKKLGEGSELDVCLRKINDFIEPHKNKLFESGEEVFKIQGLLKENSQLRERYHTIITSLTNEVLNAHYDKLTNIIKTAFERKENSLKSRNCDNGNELLTIEEILQATSQPQHCKPVNSFRLSIQDSLCSAKPNSSSTPRPEVL